MTAPRLPGGTASGWGWLPSGRSRRSGGTAIPTAPAPQTLVDGPIRERTVDEPIVISLAPNRLVHTTVPTTPARVTVVPPSGGDSSAHTRSARMRVAPAPVRLAVKVALLAGAFVAVHAAASHLAAAAALAALLIVVLVLTARRYP